MVLCSIAVNFKRQCQNILQNRTFLSLAAHSQFQLQRGTGRKGLRQSSFLLHEPSWLPHVAKLTGMKNVNLVILFIFPRYLGKGVVPGNRIIALGYAFLMATFTVKLTTASLTQSPSCVCVFFFFQWVIQADPKSKHMCVQQRRVGLPTELE